MSRCCPPMQRFASIPIPWSPCSDLRWRPCEPLRIQTRLARRELRIRLEQLRQVYRDLADARPIYEDCPAKESVRWLAQVIDAPQARIADLLEVSPRTFQRWLSEGDPTEPVGEDARRVRVVANMVGHLRHALTGRGVLDGFERPHPLVGDRPPQAFIDEPDALPTLTRLAASTRSALSA